MSTLTQVAYTTRKTIKWGTFIIVLIIFGKIIIGAGLTFWKQLNPPPPPPPTVSFGKLPLIEFPKKEAVGGLQYKLETPTGTFPKFSDRAKVFFIPYQRPNLLALDRAKKEASQMGFIQEPEAVSEKVYQWRKPNEGLMLVMDTVSGSFDLTYDWQKDQDLLMARNLPGKEQAIKEAINFIQKTKTVELDLLDGRMEVNYVKFSAGKLLSAISPSEANFAKVDMFRKNIDELPVYTGDSNKGIVSVLISGSTDNQKRYVNVDFNYFPIQYNAFATYPIKKASQAWEEIKNGLSYISRWNGKGIVTVRRIYLAYFESEKPQSFLQPIYVFEGDDNFLAFVPAITSNWLAGVSK